MNNTGIIIKIIDLNKYYTGLGLDSNIKHAKIYVNKNYIKEAIDKLKNKYSNSHLEFIKVELKELSKSTNLDELLN